MAGLALLDIRPAFKAAMMRRGAAGTRNSKYAREAEEKAQEWIHPCADTQFMGKCTRSSGGKDAFFYKMVLSKLEILGKKSAAQRM